MTRDTLYRQNNASTDTIKGLFPYMSEEIITYNNACNTIDEANSQGLTTTPGVTTVLVACSPTSTSYNYVYNYYLMDPDTEEYPSAPTESVNTSATSAWN